MMDLTPLHSPLVRFALNVQGICTVDWDGAPRGACKKCLVGVEWDKLRQRLGTDLVAGKRSLRPVIVMNDWKTHELLATVLRIISEVCANSAHCCSDS